MTAKQALERAEKAHDEDAGSFEERNRAYVARREAELAMAQAELKKAEQARARAVEAYRERQARLRQVAEDRLEEEREARREAERSARAAIASLQEVASVKEESRGTVITLDGAVLFLTGKSELLPLAREKLDRVAESMQNLEPDQTIVVEGHTDAQGSEQNNLALSQARAEAVRSYLVSRGVDSERIRAVGRGESQPVASNDTPEGRANNRRVEIVVSKQSQAPSP